MSVRYYDWIAHHGRRKPDKIALVDLASGRSFSYGKLNDRVSRLAGHLRDALKVDRGDRVAVLALNTTDTMEVQFACFRLGAVFLPGPLGLGTKPSARTPQTAAMTVAWYAIGGLVAGAVYHCLRTDDASG